MLLIAVPMVSAIFFTTTRGRRWLKAIGFSSFRRSRVPSEDFEFMLDACGRDPAEVSKRLGAERNRFPGLDESQLYRKAIRTEIKSRTAKRGEFRVQ